MSDPIRDRLLIFRCKCMMRLVSSDAIPSYARPYVLLQMEKTMNEVLACIQTSQRSYVATLCSASAKIARKFTFGLLFRFAMKMMFTKINPQAFSFSVQRLKDETARVGEENIREVCIMRGLSRTHLIHNNFKLRVNGTLAQLHDKLFDSIHPIAIWVAGVENQDEILGRL